MTGILYGVGVGPGDPELMTLKAVRVIRETGVIAAPGEDVRETMAYRIAVQAVPEMEGKEFLPIRMPMVMNQEEQRENHRRGARQIESVLDSGRDVAFITLGDSTIYSTFSYLQEIVEADGYETRLVSGIPSFCAAAAELNVPLTTWQEQLHVIPARQSLHAKLDQPGTYVLMKSGSRMAETKKMLADSGRRVRMVENCGMPDERIYQNLEEIPDDAGYFSLIVAKEP